MKRLEATVTGHVQGVFFRHYTEQEARRLQITGWVTNQPDGSVRVVAEGVEADLTQLVDFLHIGSPQAQVERVDATWATATGEFKDFRTRWL